MNKEGDAADEYIIISFGGEKGRGMSRAATSLKWVFEKEGGSRHGK
jgi:hypothetical protein